MRAAVCTNNTRFHPQNILFRRFVTADGIRLMGLLCPALLEMLERPKTLRESRT